MSVNILHQKTMIIMSLVLIVGNTHAGSLEAFMLSTPYPAQPMDELKIAKKNSKMDSEQYLLKSWPLTQMCTLYQDSAI